MKKGGVCGIRDSATGLRHPDGKTLESQWVFVAGVVDAGCAGRINILNIDLSCLDSI